VATRIFDVETTVAASPEQAIDFLLELDRHYGLHTYVESAVRVSQGTDVEGEWTEWDIVERPALGPFHYRIRFRSRQIRTSATSMVGRVRPAPACTLVAASTATSTDAGTRVAEAVTVTAPWLLVDYMARHARIAHTRLFQGLPGELGAAPSAG
jgi:hypothetical protein